MKITGLFSLVFIIAGQFTMPISGALCSEDQAPLLLDRDIKTVISDLETGIPELMQKARIEGLQIALIRNGKVVYEKGYGNKSSVTGGPVTVETIFEAASLTKPLFAYAVMKMVDEGLIDLDRPLLGYLPREQVEQELGHSLEEEGFRLDWFEKITARHVLCHSAGTPHGEGGTPYPLFFEPGSKWKYSAAGYYFLQKVVEHMKGKSLDIVIDEYVLKPLGMKRSCMVWRDGYEKTMSKGHDAFGQPQDFRKRTEAHAAATLYTTAGEYARFVCAVMNGEGLTSETHKEMLTSFINMNDEWNLEWSLGFGLQNDGNGTAFWQWGDYGIFRNYIIAYPVHGTGVVYLTNSFHGLAVCGDLVARSIGGRALGNTALEYLPYDSPLYTVVWDLKDNGPDAARIKLPGLIKQYPETFTRERLSGIGGLFEEQRMFAEAIAIFECNLEAHPRSGRAMYSLARACLGAGEYERARGLYSKSLEAAEDSVEAAGVEWAMDYIKALEEPLQLDEKYLRKLAGDYETRHLSVEKGTLYYFRENTGSTEPRPLSALARDTFILEGTVFFKLKVEFDDSGNPVKLIGLYENGSRDESLRTK